MRFFFVFFLLVATSIAADKVSSKFDDIDVDKILQNTRVLTNYIKCILGEGPCTSEGRELKKTLPDALRTGCNKCDEKQKSMVDKVINHLRTKRPTDWEKLTAKFDPRGEFKENYEAKAAKKI